MMRKAIAVAGFLVASVALLAQDAEKVLQRTPGPEVNGAQAEAATNWTDGIITATGIGPPQPAAPPGLEFAWQRRVAVTMAERLMAEQVGGVLVTSETTVEQYVLTSDVVKTKTQALLRGHRIIDEGYLADGKNYYVTMAVRLSGEGSLAAIVRPEAPRVEDAIAEVRRQPEPPPALTPPAVDPAEPILDVRPPENRPAPPQPLPDRKPGPYTGLVVDCRGFSLLPAMAPLLVREDASIVWGRITADPDAVLASGIVGYSRSLERALDAQGSRAGNNPLVVRAIGRHGSAKANPVLSAADAELILAENNKTRFLDEWKVLFVVDGK